MAKHKSQERFWSSEQAFSWGMFGNVDALSENGSQRTENPPIRSYSAVRKALRDGIARGAVAPRGFDPAKPLEGREDISSELFELHKSLAIEANGGTINTRPWKTELNFDKRGIVFKAAEIRKLFAPTSPELDKWMEEDLARFPAKKRIDRVGDCRKACGCTKAKATEAFNRLPQHSRRGRGQRI